MSDLTVKEVMTSENKIFNSKNLIESFTKEMIHKERMNGQYKCPLCLEELIFRSSGDFQNHFRHQQNSINKDCPYRSINSNLTVTQIDAIKYANTKESLEHIKMKHFIMTSAHKDIRFSNVKEEVVQKNSSFLEKSKWRRPDVSVTYKREGRNINIAFEVQLQTIMIYHITGRQSFYKNNNFFMIWVFKDDDIEKYNYSQGDIFYNNNMNGFFINDEVIKESEMQNKLMLGCKYKKFELNDLNMNEKYITEIVDFDKLTFDEMTRNVFYFDVEKERNVLLKKQKELKFINGNSFKLLDNGSSYIYIKNIKARFFISKAKSNSFYINKKQGEKSEIIKDKWFHKIEDAKKYIYDNFYKEVEDK